MPSLIAVQLSDNFEYWRLLTNNLVSWANIGVYANGTPTANGANVVIVGDVTANTYNLREVSPQISFQNVANSTLAYLKYDAAANAVVLFSQAANNSLRYYANGSLQVGGVPIVTISATQTLTGKTLTSPTITGANITGGSVSGLTTDITIADGGTGSSNTSGARTNLGLAIGTDVQAFDAGLLSVANLTTGANLMIYTTASDVYATTALTGFARNILDDPDAATVRTTLGLGNSALANTTDFVNVTATQTITGSKTFSNNLFVSTSNATTLAEYIRLTPSDFAVGKPYFTIQKTANATAWNISLYDGATNTGTINFASSLLTWNGAQIADLSTAQLFLNKSLNSPSIAGGTFSGTINYVTQAINSNNTVLATTAYVDRAVGSGGGSFQPYDDALLSIANLTTSADKMIYSTAADTYAITTLTSYGRQLIDDTDAATARATLGLGNVAITATTDYVQTTGAQVVNGVKQWAGANATTSADVSVFRHNEALATGKPWLYIQKSNIANAYNINLYDGVNNNGVLNFGASQLAWNGTLFGNVVFQSTANLISANTNGGVQTMNGGLQIFHGTANSSTNTNLFVVRPSNFSTGNPSFTIRKSTTPSIYDLSLFDSTNNTGTINIDASAFTWSGVPLVTTTSSQTLTNKIMTSPVLNTPSLVGAAATSGFSLQGVFTMGSTTNGNAAMEIGYIGGSATTPLMDFHSGATATDYDSRIIASGGNGSSGGGTLAILAATFTYNGNPIATLTSPTFTGTPAAPTAAPGTNSTQIATTAFATAADALIATPAGTISAFAGFTVPTGWLECDGSLVSRSTYPNLLSALTISLTGTSNTANATIVGTSKDISVYKFQLYQAVVESPAIGTANVAYVASSTSNTFTVNSNPGLVGVVANGLNTFVIFPYGNGDGSTTFKVPDLRGEFIRGWSNGRSVDTGRGMASSQADAFEAHTHVVGATQATNTTTGGGGNRLSSMSGNDSTTATSSSGAASETRPRNIAMRYIIKI